MSNKLTDWIAGLGTNLNFVAFNAHVGFSFILLSLFPSFLTLIGLVIGCAIKEFWFDANFEIPKQTGSDNWGDYLGYMTGVVLWVVWLFGWI